MQKLILLFSIAVAALGQVTIPNTKAGENLHAWLDAINSGNRPAVLAYLTKYQPDRQDRVDELMAFHDQTGGFNLIRIERSQSLQVDALIQEREGGHYGLVTIDVNDSTPPTVKHLNAKIVPAPAGTIQVTRLTFEEAVRALDAKAMEANAGDKFSGAVLIARNGKIALQKAYGLADRDQHVPNTVETRFRIGSMNKMFTAIAILQLVGEGKVDLSAPIGRYLPGYPNREVATKVTVRHLLTHTGGTGDIFTPEYEQHRLDMRQPGDYLKLFGARGLTFQPGSQWSYSNYGFVLLGKIIETVTGMSYYDYVRQRIFLPAGMLSTDSAPEQERTPNLAHGYLKKNGSWTDNRDTLPWRASPAGGGYSTVQDLFRFATALASGKLLKPNLFAELTTKQSSPSGAPPGTGYGYGMMIAEPPQGHRIGHGGGAPGMNGELYFYPQSNTVVVTLANMDPPSASNLAEYFDERMPIE